VPSGKIGWKSPWHHQKHIAVYQAVNIVNAEGANGAVNASGLPIILSAMSLK